MATSTEVAIATTTLGSSASSITFSGITGTYTDLRLVLTATKNSGVANAQPGLQFNGVTTTTYSYTLLSGNGTAASSGALTNNAEIDLANGNLNNTLPAFFAINIFAYAGSTNKTVLWEANQDQNGSGSVLRGVGLWRGTAAITSITLFDIFGGAGFAAGTTATLYGIN